MKNDEQMARALQESLSANSPPRENGNSHGFQQIRSNLRYYIHLSIYIYLYIYRSNLREGGREGGSAGEREGDESDGG